MFRMPLMLKTHATRSLLVAEMSEDGKGELRKSSILEDARRSDGMKKSTKRNARFMKFLRAREFSIISGDCRGAIYGALPCLCTRLAGRDESRPYFDN